MLALVAACGGDSPTQLPGPPAGIVVVSGNEQQGTVGAAVATAPSVRVRDASGRGVAGVTVQFDVIAGGGSVTGNSVVTDEDGVATVGEWRLGPVPGANTLRAQALNHPLQVSITATSSPGAPSSIQVVTGGANLAAIVGQEVIPKPQVRVRDAFGNPVPNATVTWVVTDGGGQIVGGNTSQTNAEGLATIAGWKLGPVSGTNKVQARTSNGLVVTINALGIGVPQALIPESPTNQDGYINFAVPRIARVRVVDEFGANVAGLPVVFKMTAGTGTIIGDTVVTDADGIAALGDWKLGATGFSQVTASVPGFTGPEAVFTANGVARPYTIDVRFVGATPPDIRDAYIAGAMRWMEIIIGDLPDYNIPNTITSCGGFAIPATSGVVEDVIIYARVAPIDGEGQIIGQAGPCAARTPGYRSAVGGMTFDIDDANDMLEQGQFVDVVIHEMGHVLGILQTGFEAAGHMNGANTNDPTFRGPLALAAWPSLGVTYSGTPIPLENDPNGGSLRSHWREAILEHELMTGTIETPGTPMPLSAITVSALADLGYTVDFTKADPYAPALHRPLDGRGERKVLREILYIGDRRIN